MRLPRGLLRAAMRARGQLPAGTWPTMLQLASLLPGDLPVVGPPRARRVLVLAPHPDDETIGCGGTIALLAAAGTEIVVVVATDGEATIGSPYGPDETAARRRAEATAACAVLGAGRPVFLGLPDGALARSRADLQAGLRRVHDRLDPDLVLAPWPLDRHADHRTCAAAVADLVAPTTEVWGYEAHVPLTPTRAVDITSVIEHKRAALAAHETAGFAMELDATLALNRWRSLPVTGGTGWAEVFLGTTGVTWRRAVTLAAAVPGSFSPRRAGPARPGRSPAPPG